MVFPKESVIHRHVEAAVRGGVEQAVEAVLGVRHFRPFLGVAFSLDPSCPTTRAQRAPRHARIGQDDGVAQGAIIGLDVGTTRVKGLLVTTSGRVIAESARPTPWVHNGAEADMDAQELIPVVREVITELAQGTNAQIAGIGVAGMAEAGVLLNAQSEPVSRIIAWHDPRGEVTDLREAIGKETFMRHVGMRLNSKPSVAKILWWQKNSTPARTATTYLSVGEWVVHALGGDQVSELSLLSRTGLFDVVAKEPWQETLGLTGELLPGKIILAGERAGSVTSTYLPANVLGAALTVAGMDHQAAAFISGAATTDTLFDSMGTAEALLRFVPGPLSHDVLHTLGEHDVAVLWGVIPDHVCVLAAFLTGLSLERVSALMGATDRNARRAIAEQALTHDRGQISVSSAEHTGITITGVNDDASPAALWRAAVEDLLATSATAVEFMDQQVGARTGTVIAGGWINDPLVQQVKREQLGNFRVSEVNEAGALGAAFFGGIAAGVLDRPATTTTPRWQAS